MSLRIVLAYKASAQKRFVRIPNPFAVSISAQFLFPGTRVLGQHELLLVDFQLPYHFPKTMSQKTAEQALNHSKMDLLTWENIGNNKQLFISLKLCAILVFSKGAVKVSVLEGWGAGSLYERCWTFPGWIVVSTSGIRCLVNIVPLNIKPLRCLETWCINRLVTSRRIPRERRTPQEITDLRVCAMSFSCVLMCKLPCFCVLLC
jgi:hypothetical protein